MTGTDADGNPPTLEAFDDTRFGFLRVTVGAASASGEFVGVDKTTGAGATRDRFTLDLAAHRGR